MQRLESFLVRGPLPGANTYVDQLREKFTEDLVLQIELQAFSCQLAFLKDDRSLGAVLCKRVGGATETPEMLLTSLSVVSMLPNVGFFST